jgi:glycine/D-amino acid oxidase-like deaminating enzyme
MQSSCKAPAIVPFGWEVVSDHDGQFIRRRFANRMCVTYSIEVYTEDDTDGGRGPLESYGTFKRMVISFPDRHPTWEEMRDYIRTCGLFDRTRDVFMVLPPDADYVNKHPHAFHWWQKEA